VEFKYTKWQVARGARPDAEAFGHFLLIKRAQELRATYQLRLLTFRAVQQSKKLVIEVPKKCKIHRDLQELRKQHIRTVIIKRT
jgi:hypothetical protein